MSVIIERNFGKVRMVGSIRKPIELQKSWLGQGFA